MHDGWETYNMLDHTGKKLPAEQKLGCALICPIYFLLGGASFSSMNSVKAQLELRLIALAGYLRSTGSSNTLVSQNYYAYFKDC